MPDFTKMLGAVGKVLGGAGDDIAKGVGKVATSGLEMASKVGAKLGVAADDVAILAQKYPGATKTAIALTALGATAAVDSLMFGSNAITKENVFGIIRGFVESANKDKAKAEAAIAELGQEEQTKILTLGVESINDDITAAMQQIRSGTKAGAPEVLIKMKVDAIMTFNSLLGMNKADISIDIPPELQAGAQGGVQQSQGNLMMGTPPPGGVPVQSSALAQMYANRNMTTTVEPPRMQSPVFPSDAPIVGQMPMQQPVAGGQTGTLSVLGEMTRIASDMSKLKRMLGIQSDRELIEAIGLLRSLMSMDPKQLLDIINFKEKL